MSTNSLTGVAASFFGSRHSVQDRLLLFRRKAARQVGLEFLDQDRHAFLAPALVADRVFDHHFLEAASVLELDGDAVGDRALVRVVIIPGELLVLDADDLVAKFVDARIGGHIVFVVGGGQTPEDHRHRHHVLDAMVAIGRIVQRAFLVDDADGCFVRADGDFS